MTVRGRGGPAPAAPRRLLVALSALVATLSACHHAPANIAPPPPSASRIGVLQRAIDAVLAAPELARGTWGIEVRSLARNETLYALNPGKLLMPASTMKVVTLGAAVDRLGWDYTYRTSLMASGTIDGGVLSGDLVVVGSGDPTLDDWAGAASTLFDGWATSLKQAGIRSVTGRVIGDDNLFDDNGIGAGWAWDDLGASYATGVGALQFNENTAQLVVTPGATSNDPASVAVNPASAHVPVRNHAATSDAGTAASVTVQPVPRSPDLEVRGRVPVGSPPIVRNVSVGNPTLYFANALREGLIRNGIEIAGAAVDIDDLSDPPTEASAVAIAESATTLPVLAGTMMQLSQNLFAETLLRTLGVQGSGSGSVEAGRAVVKAALTGWGVSANDVLIVDGSGLSRYNVITPDALVKVLAHVYADDRLRDSYVAALPAPGTSGTLAERMKGTAAAGKVRAKTGSFTNARALAGYVRTADDEPLAFAILANNFNAESAVIDGATDAIVVALASFSRR